MTATRAGQSSGPPSADATVPSPQSLPRQAIRYALTGITIIILTGIYAALGIAWFWPQPLAMDGQLTLLIAWSAFLLQVLLFHLGLFTALVMLGAAIARQWRLVGAALPALLLAIVPEYTNRSPTPAIAEPSALPGIRLLSWNVLAYRDPSTETIAAILDTDADVIALQEYTPALHRLLEPALEATHPHSIVAPRRDAFGQALFSRFPFHAPPQLDRALSPTTSPQLRVTLDIEGRQVTLHTIHLVPPVRPSYSAVQRREFANLLALLDNRHTPTVVCGDFNFTPRTFFAHRLAAAGFHDTLDRASFSRHATWPGRGIHRFLPGLRLDHVYVSPHIHARRVELLPAHGSDHHPILAELVLTAPHAAD